MKPFKFFLILITLALTGKPSITAKSRVDPVSIVGQSDLTQTPTPGFQIHIPIIFDCTEKTTG